MVLVYVSYDISRRTTSPGSKGQLMKRLRDRYDDTPKNPVGDSLAIDSAARITPQQ
jgi:hypothetical protein